MLASLGDADLPLPILLVRQDTHVGSLWITKLLEAQQQVSAFFQFDGGQCSRPRQPPRPRGTPQLFEEGCGCQGAHAGDKSSSVKAGHLSKEDAFCHGQCTAPPAGAPCKAVLAMADTPRAREILQRTRFTARRFLWMRSAMQSRRLWRTALARRTW